jgi:hypothetical protein
MPLDPRPVATGNVFLISANQRDRLNYADTGALAQVLTDRDFLNTESYPVARRYTSHFATCPRAEEAKAAAKKRREEQAAKEAANQVATRRTLGVDEPREPEQLAMFDGDKERP